jgi:hypothetical protein
MVLVQNKTRYAYKLEQRYYYNKFSVDVSSPSTSNTLTKPRNLLRPFATQRHQTVSTSTMSAPTFPNFSDLFTELHIEILRRFLCTPFTINTHRHENIFRRRLVSISLVSKHLHTLATQIYYQGNTFHCSRESSFLRDAKIIRLPNPAMGKYVRRLEFNLQVSAHIPDLRYIFHTVAHYKYRSYTPYSPTNLLDADEKPSYFRPADIMTLIRPKLPVKYHESLPQCTPGEYRSLVGVCNDTLGREWDELVRWQRHFCALKHVKLVFQLRDCIQDRERRILEALPRLAETWLRAGKIEVVVHHKNSGFRHSWCNSNCVAVIERVFTTIVNEASTRRVKEQGGSQIDQK